MVKWGFIVKEKDVFEDQAITQLCGLLRQVPVIDDVDAEKQYSRVDAVLNVRTGNTAYLLACEVKSNGQPRFIQAAITQLQAFMFSTEGAFVPVIIAPWLSPDAQALCNENGIAFLDMEGNARIMFGGVYIEHRTTNKPVVEKRSLRSLFSPKSTQVLRTILKDPHRTWRVVELAKESHVSLGQVSNVRNGLLNRNFAVVQNDGLRVLKPNLIIDAWQTSYQPPAGETLNFYTTLHGSALESRLREVLCCSEKAGNAILASFSAAQWLAPYGRTGVDYFYADKKGLEKLVSALELSPSSKGANILITLPKDAGIFRDTIEPAEGVFSTSAVQTYLDLSTYGERGIEAAEHLRNQGIW